MIGEEPDLRRREVLALERIEQLMDDYLGLTLAVTGSHPKLDVEDPGLFTLVEEMRARRAIREMNR